MFVLFATVPNNKLIRVCTQRSTLPVLHILHVVLVLVLVVLQFRSNFACDTVLALIVRRRDTNIDF